MKKNQKYRQSFKQFGSVKQDLGPHCLQTKNDRDDAPTHPLTEIPGIAHERHMRIKSGGPGPLTIAVLVLTHRLIRLYGDRTTALRLIR